MEFLRDDWLRKYESSNMLSTLMHLIKVCMHAICSMWCLWGLCFEQGGFIYNTTVFKHSCLNHLVASSFLDVECKLICTYDSGGETGNHDSEIIE